MSAYRETKIHGSHAFPYVVYLGLLPEYISGFPLHWHEEMEIIYVQKGMVNVSVRNTEYTVHSGEFVLIHPQSVHAIRQHEDHSGVYYNILFRLSLLESGSGDICRKKYLEPLYNRELLMPVFISLSHPLNERIAPLIRALLIDPQQQSLHGELLIKARLFEIMHHILPCCEKSDKTTAHEEALFEKLKRSLLYLEKNYAENLTVKRMAAVSNYSESHFSKLFRQMTGESFTQYLKNYRLEVAADRLVHEDTRISEIAVSCGFSNMSYFTRAFYEKFRTTPSGFRKAGSANSESR